MKFGKHSQGMPVHATASVALPCKAVLRRHLLLLPEALLRPGLSGQNDVPEAFVHLRRR